MSIDVWDMQWSDLGRGRLKKIKVNVKGSQSSVCELGTCPRVPAEGMRMSFDVNWPPLCQSTVRQQNKQWSAVCGCKKCDGDVRKL